MAETNACHLYLIGVKCKPIRDRCEPCQRLGFVVVSHCTTSHISYILTTHLRAVKLVAVVVWTIIWKSNRRTLH